MKMEGIWTIEVYGPFGWESRGILIFDKDGVVGGGNRHYSVGSYKLMGDKFTADMQIHYYGPPRTMFGEDKEEFATHLEGEFNEDVITGVATRPDKSEFELPAKLTRRLDLLSQH